MKRANKRFSGIEMNLTATNAARLLSEYPKRRAMAKHWGFGMRTPKIDAMPHSNSSTNMAEIVISDHIDDETFVEQCEVIVREIMPEIDSETTWPKILDNYYLKQIGTDEVVMERLGYARSSYYEAKKKALCAFAELWPSSQNKLVVLAQKE